MHIKKISLRDFRNLGNMNIELNYGVNIFYGNNAQGKTNILEAVYISSTGRSHRTHNDKELIRFGENEAHIQVISQNGNLTDRIDVHLKREEKKGIAVNNIPIKKLGELFGIIFVVMFSPEDLQLIKSGPSERRRFVDMELCQISNVYYYDLQQYYKVLKQRNNLLKLIQKDKSLRETIFVWDSQLVSFGNKIISARQKFIDNISETAASIHEKLTGGNEILSIHYKKSTNSDEYFEKLEKNIERDIIYGSTSYGPHKDDLYFKINDIDARSYGSQGQQRCAALSAKLAEIEIIKREKNSKPVLLLDDVLSELDESRQRFLIDSINGIQTFITCTGIEDLIRSIGSNISVYHVENGFVTVKN